MAIASRAEMAWGQARWGAAARTRPLPRWGAMAQGRRRWLASSAARHAAAAQSLGPGGSSAITHTRSANKRAARSPATPSWKLAAARFEGSMALSRADRSSSAAAPSAARILDASRLSSGGIAGGNFMLLGAPGAGKGTYSKHLSAAFG